MAQLFTFSLPNWIIKILRPRAQNRHTTIQVLCREIVAEKLKAETPEAPETGGPE